MSWEKIPLPDRIYPSTDQAILPDRIGERLVDGYIDEFGSIRKRPGLLDFVNINIGAGIDGIYWWDEKSKAVFVCNGRIYVITASDGSNEDITGDTLNVGGRVHFTTNGTYLIMANGGRMVHYNNSGTTIQMADADAPTVVSHVDFLDNYILATDGYNLGRWQYSDVNNPLSWNPLSFYTAEAKPDALNAIIVVNREIHLFGERSVEFWYNDGSSPFRRRDFVLERGLIAKHSLVNCGGDLLWLDHERRVMRMPAGSRSPEYISMPFDDVIRDLNSALDAYALFIPIGVRAFYVLTFPTENRTFAYDLSVNQWAEWGQWNSGNASYDRYIGSSFCYAKDWGFYLVADRSSGKVYKMDAEAYSDAGATIRTLLQTGNVSHGTFAKKSSRKVVMRLKRGTGSGTVLANEPKINVRWRNDGVDWRMDTGIEVSLGASGEYNYFARALQAMGQYRTRQFEFVHSDDSDFILVGLEEDVEPLDY